MSLPFNRPAAIMFLKSLATGRYKIITFLYVLAGVGTTDSALGEDGVLDIDTTISLETTWHDMEKLVSMGLVRSIGIRYYKLPLKKIILKSYRVSDIIGPSSFQYLYKSFCVVTVI